MALVDSGADYPIFPMETAEHDLGLDLTRAEAWNFSGTSGVIQTAKLSRVLMTILKPDGSHWCEILTTCAFCETFRMSVLLGQNGFFSSFKTTFHQPDGYFEIERLPVAS